jgi:hypothetical protein
MRSDAIKKIAGMELKGLLIARSMVVYLTMVFVVSGAGSNRK